MEIFLMGSNSKLKMLNCMGRLNAFGAMIPSLSGFWVFFPPFQAQRRSKSYKLKALRDKRAESIQKKTKLQKLFVFHIKVSSLNRI